MAQMHNSFLVKNGYMLVARTNQLWVQVVRAKYKVDSQIQRFFILEMALGYGKVYASETLAAYVLQLDKLPSYHISVRAIIGIVLPLYFNLSA
ncbi:hypothetical protein GOBAR_AA13721 [Gossypium barbadense]|uniref:Uncharacterized protein n=1 Tax=Gossypium barbadense TaxID=3634 RepID=A0A2P5XU92_GOSBA|nr:hypothetical protein GOBAR_AA13721 [Gossypium barbadense]